MVEQKEFREDLFYRLHVIRIHVPALRERRGDISILASHFLTETCRQNGLPARKFSKDALAALETQSWPGNVRELKNLIEGAAILADGEEIQADELKSMTAAGRSPVGAGADFLGVDTLEQFKAASEREFIRRKLDENKGNIKRTAERIQIQRSNLYKKLDRYGLR